MLPRAAWTVRSRHQTRVAGYRPFAVANFWVNTTGQLLSQSRSALTGSDERASQDETSPEYILVWRMDGRTDG